MEQLLETLNALDYERRLDVSRVHEENARREELEKRTNKLIEACNAEARQEAWLKGALRRLAEEDIKTLTGMIDQATIDMKRSRDEHSFLSARVEQEKRTIQEKIAQVKRQREKLTEDLSSFVTKAEQREDVALLHALQKEYAQLEQDANNITPRDVETTKESEIQAPSLMEQDEPVSEEEFEELERTCSDLEALLASKQAELANLLQQQEEEEDTSNELLQQQQQQQQANEGAKDLEEEQQQQDQTTKMEEYKRVHQQRQQELLEREKGIQERITASQRSVQAYDELKACLAKQKQAMEDKLCKACVDAKQQQQQRQQQQ